MLTNMYTQRNTSFYMILIHYVAQYLRKHPPPPQDMQASLNATSCQVWTHTSAGTKTEIQAEPSYYKCFQGSNCLQ